jgi:hypothetical protein
MQRLALLFLLAPLTAFADSPKADPAATKLLADAIAARATWENFPGFAADVEINIDGKITKGTVSVDAKAKPTVQVDDEAAKKWASNILASIVGHRLPSGGGDTPCAFADDDATHPLGRAIKVVGDDDFHSSYRIRDKQVIVVNRVMNTTRFTITVTENLLNAEKQQLPAHFVVNYWDNKTDALQRSEAHEQTWERIGRFDLPRTTTVVTASAGKQETRSLKLTNVRLLKTTSTK